MNDIEDQIFTLHEIQAELEALSDFLKRIILELDTEVDNALGSGLFVQHYNQLKQNMDYTDAAINNLIDLVDNDCITHIEEIVEYLNKL